MLAWSLVGVGQLEQAAKVLSTCARLQGDKIGDRYLFADLFHDIARIRAHLRTREADAALAAARRLPANMKRDGLWHVASFRDEARSLIACAELQVWLRAPTGAARRRLRKIARQLRGGSIYQQGNAALIEATLAELAGRSSVAAARLATAEARFETASVEAHLACTRLRRAALVGAEERAELQALAQDYFQRERVQAPQDLVMMLAPGPGCRG
mgnify:CR=1 FL=1